jgi:hypothetical protein
MEKFCHCGALKAKYYTQGNFRHFCPVCQPEVAERMEDQRYDALDMLAEMKTGDIDDGYSN